MCGQPSLVKKMPISFDITYVLSYSMEQSSSLEANRFAASQEISRILWNQEVNYRIQKFPSPFSILSQLGAFHTHTPHFLKILHNPLAP
jgi:hypothetical protein